MTLYHVWGHFRAWRLRMKAAEDQFQQWFEYQENRLDTRFKEAMGLSGLCSAIFVLVGYAIRDASPWALLWLLLPAAPVVSVYLRDGRVMRDSQAELEAAGLREPEPWNGKGTPPTRTDTEATA